MSKKEMKAMTVSEMIEELRKLEVQGKGDYTLCYEICCEFEAPFSVNDESKTVNIDGI